MPQVRRSSHALVTTATIGAVVALLTATIALAAVSAKPGNRPALAATEASEPASGPLDLGRLKGLAPPPGAALLLIAGLLAARRGHR